MLMQAQPRASTCTATMGWFAVLYLAELALEALQRAAHNAHMVAGAEDALPHLHLLLGLPQHETEGVYLGIGDDGGGALACCFLLTERSLCTLTRAATQCFGHASRSSVTLTAVAGLSPFSICVCAILLPLTGIYKVQMGFTLQS